MQTRAALAFVGLVVYLALAFGLRTLLHRRTTGTSGWRGFSGAPGSLEWLGGILFASSLLAGFVAVALALLAWSPLLWDPSAATDVAGGFLVVCGVTGTLWSQASMGGSWRIGVDRSERTELVTQGPFRLARNPIFTSMALAAIGLMLLLPTALTSTALVLLVAGVELQVRFVEEPYLVRTHGERYRAYARRVGRFAPFAGRFR